MKNRIVRRSCRQKTPKGLREQAQACARPMTSLATIIFALTYIGMALGRIPGLKIDRSGIALIAAVILVATGEVPAEQIAKAMHFPTLLLMGGLMILSARVRAAGFYEVAATSIAPPPRQPF